MGEQYDRICTLLSDTVTLLCKNSLQYVDELKIQGLIAITVDKDVLVVHINDFFPTDKDRKIKLNEDDSMTYGQQIRKRKEMNAKSHSNETLSHEVTFKRKSKSSYFPPASSQESQTFLKKEQYSEAMAFGKREITYIDDDNEVGMDGSESFQQNANDGDMADSYPLQNHQSLYDTTDSFADEENDVKPTINNAEEWNLNDEGGTINSVMPWSTSNSTHSNNVPDHSSWNNSSLQSVKRSFNGNNFESGFSKVSRQKRNKSLGNVINVKSELKSSRRVPHPYRVRTGPISNSRANVNSVDEERLNSGGYSYGRLTSTKFVCNLCEATYKHQCNLLTHQVRVHGRQKKNTGRKPKNFDPFMDNFAKSE